MRAEQARLRGLLEAALDALDYGTTDLLLLPSVLDG
jgi:hypothetical protein